MTENLLHQFDYLPEGLLACDASELHQHLPGPSLIHLEGRRQAPLFVSVLLHGNEPVGWQAIQQLLQHYQDQQMPRSLSLFIGNVSAAKQGMRRLDGQPDYNRVWGGGTTPEHAMADQIVSTMRERKPFASIDIHNNTGLNPHYACVNRVENRFFWLATYFSRTVVYFIRPEGVQSAAFAEICPAVTVECGQPGQRHGVEHAAEFLDALLNLAELPDKPVPEHDIDVFHTVAIVKVPEQLNFDFSLSEDDGCSDAPLQFVKDLDHMNFRELTPGTVLGMIEGDSASVQLEVIDDHGQDRWHDFFEIKDQQLSIAQSVMPSMLTLDKKVIRQDCLCYLMERMPLLSKS